MSEKCRGCQRNEEHKMCPAYCTPFYMSGVLFTPEIEKLFPSMPDRITEWELEQQLSAASQRAERAEAILTRIATQCGQHGDQHHGMAETLVSLMLVEKSEVEAELAASRKLIESMRDHMQGVFYLCERCGGIGRQPAGCWDGKAYAAPAGVCESCGGVGYLGLIERKGPIQSIAEADDIADAWRRAAKKAQDELAALIRRMDDSPVRGEPLADPVERIGYRTRELADYKRDHDAMEALRNSGPVRLSNKGHNGYWWCYLGYEDESKCVQANDPAEAILKSKGPT